MSETYAVSEYYEHELDSYSNDKTIESTRTYIEVLKSLGYNVWYMYGPTALYKSTSLMARISELDNFSNVLNKDDMFFIREITNDKKIRFAKLTKSDFDLIERNEKNEQINR